MNARVARALIAPFCFALPLATSAAQWRPLTFARDTSFNLKTLGVQRQAQVLAGRDGRMIVSSESFGTDVLAFDSAFTKLPFTIHLGRPPMSGDIAWIQQWGWVGDTLWILDPYYRQIAYLGADASVRTSVPFPSWIRPFWRDRRKYPLFSTQVWYAAYPDGTLLVEPQQARHLLDTPGYDPNLRMLVRIDRDGRILRTVATMPVMDGRFQLRSGTERQWVAVPNYPRTAWRVSTDGRRVAVVAPLASDSGAFRITALDENGDTVFSRRYAVPATRIARGRVDTVMAAQRAFGRYTVEQVRDTVRKLMPAFYSPVAGVEVGLDYSIWVSIRRPTTRMEDAEYFVVDARGEPQGIMTVLRPTRFAARSLDKVWVIQQDRVKQATLLIRFLRRDARVAPPSRSARDAASSSPARPPE